MLRGDGGLDQAGLDWHGYNGPSTQLHDICLQNMFKGFCDIFQHRQPSLWFSGHQLCPTMQFSSGSNSLDLAPESTDLRAQTHKNVLTLDASHKYWVPRLHTFCPTWLQIGVSTPPPQFNNWLDWLIELRKTV